LVDLVSLAAERVAQSVVEGDELAQLVAADVRDPEAEVVFLEAADAVGQGLERPADRPEGPGRQPGRERPPDEQAREEDRQRRPAARGGPCRARGCREQRDPDVDRETPAQTEPRLHKTGSSYSLGRRSSTIPSRSIFL